MREQSFNQALEGQNSTLVADFGTVYSREDGSGAWRKSLIFKLI